VGWITERYHSKPYSKPGPHETEFLAGSPASATKFVSLRTPSGCRACASANQRNGSAKAAEEWKNVAEKAELKSDPLPVVGWAASRTLREFLEGQK
jgi:hypothetical protein